MSNISENLLRETMFDQYSRYKSCADVLLSIHPEGNKTVLDIGSGELCLLGKFLANFHVTYLDPLFKKQEILKDNQLAGDIWSRELDGRIFDYIVSIDTLEHVPGQLRNDFLKRISELAVEGIILACPCEDAGEALSVDIIANKSYKEFKGKDYAWLAEHFEYGLPKLSEIKDFFEANQYNVYLSQNGNSEWLKKILPFIIKANEIVHLKPYIEEINYRFNKNLYIFDNRIPAYRQVLIALKNKVDRLENIKNVIVSEDYNIFWKELETMVSKDPAFFLKELNKALEHKENEFINLLEKHKVLQDEVVQVSNWIKGTEKEVADRDRIIVEQNVKIQEVSNWSSSIQSTLIQKNEELIKKDKEIEEKNEELKQEHLKLMEMSDWAYGMKLRLEDIDQSKIIKAIEKQNKNWIKMKRKLKYEGIKGVGKSILKRILPKKYLNIIKYRNKSKTYNLLKESVRKNNGKVIICFPVIPWEFRWQRPQHILSKFAENGFTVLFISMEFNCKGYRYSSIYEAGADTQATQIADNIFELHLSTENKFNVYTDALQDGNLLNLHLGISSIIQMLETKELVYMIQFPGWSNLVSKLKESDGGKIVFDCMDDHAGFSTNTKESIDREIVLTKEADLVITSSNLLDKKVRNLNQNTILVRNGTQFEHFHNIHPNEQLDKLTANPIIGYYGAISDWFDTEIIEYCAKSRPTWSFVLIGSTFGADISRLEKIPNVHFLGEKPYKDLPGYLYYFDVCTIPFKIIPLTLATNPVKFYEYISCGKPVVSVRLPELELYLDYCYLANTKEEFLLLLEKAIVEKGKPELIEKRIELAKANSWQARFEIIEDGIKQLQN